MLLTDEGSRDHYRRDVGMPGRGAFRFLTAREFLGVLNSMPPRVTHLFFDVRRGAGQQEGRARSWRIGHVRRQIAEQIRRG